MDQLTEYLHQIHWAYFCLTQINRAGFHVVDRGFKGEPVFYKNGRNNTNWDWTWFARACLASLIPDKYAGAYLYVAVLNKDGSFSVVFTNEPRTSIRKFRVYLGDHDGD